MAHRIPIIILDPQEDVIGEIKGYWTKAEEQANPFRWYDEDNISDRYARFVVRHGLAAICSLHGDSKVPHLMCQLAPDGKSDEGLMNLAEAIFESFNVSVTCPEKLETVEISTWGEYRVYRAKFLCGKAQALFVPPPASSLIVIKDMLVKGCYRMIGGKLGRMMHQFSDEIKSNSRLSGEKAE